jgi:hypothetical protein
VSAINRKLDSLKSRFASNFRDSLLSDTVKVRDTTSGSTITGQNPDGSIVFGSVGYREYAGSEVVPARIDDIRSFRREVTLAAPLTASEFMLYVPADFYVEPSDVVEHVVNGVTRYLKVTKQDDQSAWAMLNSYRCIEMSVLEVEEAGIVATTPQTITFTYTSLVDDETAVLQVSCSTRVRVDWGDGSNDVISIGFLSSIAHTYATAGAYTIILTDTEYLTHLTLGEGFTADVTGWILDNIVKLDLEGSNATVGAFTSLNPDVELLNFKDTAQDSAKLEAMLSWLHTNVDNFTQDVVLHIDGDNDAVQGLKIAATPPTTGPEYIFVLELNGWTVNYNPLEFSYGVYYLLDTFSIGTADDGRTPDIGDAVSITDTGDNLSIAGGSLVVGGRVGSNDPLYATGPFTVSDGLAFVFTWENVGQTRFYVGWQENETTPYRASVYINESLAQVKNTLSIEPTFSAPYNQPHRAAVLFNGDETIHLLNINNSGWFVCSVCDTYHLIENTVYAAVGIGNKWTTDLYIPTLAVANLTPFSSTYAYDSIAGAVVDGTTFEHPRDFVLTVTLPTPEALKTHFLYFRYADSDNYWLIKCSEGGRIVLQESISGSITTRVNNLTGATGGEIFTAIIHGATVSLFLDNSEIGEYTGALTLIDTTSGLIKYIGNSPDEWGGLTVYPIYPSTQQSDSLYQSLRESDPNKVTIPAETDTYVDTYSDGTWTMALTLPTSSNPLDRIEFIFRRSDASNYITSRIERSAANDMWNLRLIKVVAGVETELDSTTNIGDAVAYMTFRAYNNYLSVELAEESGYLYPVLEAADDFNLRARGVGSSYTGASGANLITNGTFDSDVSGWLTNNATISYDSGTALITLNAENTRVYQSISPVSGSFVLLGTISNNLGSPEFRIFDSSGTYFLPDITGNGVYGYRFSTSGVYRVNLWDFSAAPKPYTFNVDDIQFYAVANLDNETDGPQSIFSGTP